MKRVDSYTQRYVTLPIKNWETTIRGVDHLTVSQESSILSYVRRIPFVRALFPLPSLLGLADALKGTSLFQLDLDGLNWLTDRELGLFKGCTLSRLKIHHCHQVTGSAIATLAKFRTLKNLLISDCNGIRKLHLQPSNVKIVLRCLNSLAEIRIVNPKPKNPLYPKLVGPFPQFRRLHVEKGSLKQLPGNCFVEKPFAKLEELFLYCELDVPPLAVKRLCNLKTLCLARKGDVPVRLINCPDLVKQHLATMKLISRFCDLGYSEKNWIVTALIAKSTVHVQVAVEGVKDGRLFAKYGHFTGPSSFNRHYRSGKTECSFSKKGQVVPFREINFEKFDWDQTKSWSCSPAKVSLMMKGVEKKVGSVKQFSILGRYSIWNRPAIDVIKNGVKGFVLGTGISCLLTPVLGPLALIAIPITHMTYMLKNRPDGKPKDNCGTWALQKLRECGIKGVEFSSLKKYLVADSRELVNAHSRS